MKLIHTSDWHLGRIIYGRSLIEDQRYFAEHFFLNLLEAERPDAVILAGDLFDRQIAPVEALRLFDALVTEICGNRRIPVIAVSGNHDGADRLGLGGALLGKAGLHITSRLDPYAPPVVLPGRPEVHIYTLPYFDPAMARDCLKDEELRGFPAAYAAVLEILRARLDSNAFNILVAHCFVAGAETSESESPLFIGGSGEVPGSLFNGFDYVALGHLHRAQTLGERIRYSGSPLKYSFDEEHHKKSVTVLEVGDTVTIRPIPVVPLRDMRTLSGPVEALEEAACADAHKNDYISAELTGLPVYEPMHRLRRVYPNTLSVRNGSFAAAAGDEERAALRQSEPQTVFAEFMRQMCGCEAEAADLAVFSEAYVAASGRGNGHET
ncbi:MAG: exonuclease SbcCD subunit D [Candidatus Howiella sp.]|jgi:exonuclease SbcD